MDQRFPQIPLLSPLASSGNFYTPIAEPSPTVSLEKKPWFHGSISREEAEKILLSCNCDSFLIRNSTTPDKLAVSCYGFENRSLTHTAIEKINGRFKIEDKMYDSVEQIIKSLDPSFLPVYRKESPKLNLSGNTRSETDSARKGSHSPYDDIRMQIAKDPTNFQHSIELITNFLKEQTGPIPINLEIDVRYDRGTYFLQIGDLQKARTDLQRGISLAKEREAFWKNKIVIFEGLMEYVNQ